MQVTERQAADILFDDSEEFTIVEEGEFTDDGKYSHAEVVFGHEDKQYVLRVSRCGSYHTDYDYTYTLDCPEVERIEVTTHKWVTKQ